MKYYLAMQKRKGLIYATTWKKLENRMLRKKKMLGTKDHTWYNWVYMKYWEMQPIETESKLVVLLDWEWRKARGKDGVWLIMGFFKNRVYFWSNKSFLSHILVMVATTPWNTKPLNFSVIMAEIRVCCCSLSRVRLFATLWTAVNQASLSLTISQSLLKFMSIELVMLSNHLILCHPYSPFTFNLPQHQRFFRWISSSCQVAQSIGASPSASVLPMNIQGWFPLGLTGLISLWPKGLPRVFSNTIILWCSAFFIV